MRHLSLVRAAVALSLVGSAAAADAAVFTGTMNGPGFAGPDASCAPLPFGGSLTSTSGSSSLGSFTYGHDICLSGASGPVEGTFAVDFGGDSFQGSLIGNNSPSAAPGIADLLWTYTILGGTGRFLDATGTFTGIGTSDARTRPSQISFTFNGNINTVPEPGTWAMMLLGFGAVGAAVRRGKRRNGVALPEAV